LIRTSRIPALTLPVADETIAQLALQHLAAGIPGEAVDQHDLLGSLVAREALAAMIVERRNRRRLARPRHDHREERSRRSKSGWRSSANHTISGQKILVTRSRSIVASIAAGSGARSRMLMAPR